jgi:uncharacterized membrane-anchored protein YjiN (DUF445 family)
LHELRHSIADDPDFLARSEALRDEFMRHPAVQEFGRDVAGRMHGLLAAALDDPESGLRKGLIRELRRIGSCLAGNDAVATRLNEWLAGIAIYLIETYREPISSIISTTIEQWDEDATSRRIELHIGRDLQFIRINGTLVGGLVGLILYLSWTTTLG